MNYLFDLSEKNIKNVLSGAEDICKKIPERLSATDGERSASSVLLNEIKPYSDEADEEIFYARPSASVVIFKICSALLIVSSLLFKFAEASGSALTAIFSSVFFVIAFSLFSYKYIRNGKKLDLLFKKKKTSNLIFKRFARCEVKNRIVFTAKIDSDRMCGIPFLKNNAPLYITVCCVICSLISFLGLNLFLIFGSPDNSIFFSLLSSLCLLFCVFYVSVFFLFKNKTSQISASSSVVPALCCGEIMKELCNNGVRFSNTEVCIALCGSDFLSHDGEIQLINKHKNRCMEVPTTFVCLDSVFDSKFSLCYGKKVNYSEETVADIVKEIADSFAIYMKKNKNMLGTPSFLPFTDAGFDACSVGSVNNGKIDKNNIKYYGVYSDEQAVMNILLILRDILKYYDNTATLDSN